MNSKLLLCLALVLSTGLTGCTTARNHPAGLPVRYHNSQYGLTFWLPASWSGYSVLVEQWQGETYSPTLDRIVPVEHGPIVVLRHPKWTASEPYQDFPIMVFKRHQWDLDKRGEFGIGAGGIDDELWHNETYVFGMSSRYAWDDKVKGWQETGGIVATNCAVNKMARLYPE